MKTYKLASGRGSRRFLDHTKLCNGDSHSAFFYDAELPSFEAPWPGLWALYTCTHCGTKTWRNSKGEKRSFTG